MVAVPRKSAASFVLVEFSDYSDDEHLSESPRCFRWDAENALQVVHPDCDHDFPDDMRELAYRTIDSVLKSP